MKSILAAALVAGVIPFIAACERAAGPAPSEQAASPAAGAVTVKSEPTPAAVDPAASVRSVYPTAEEEKVLGLGYPTFLSYGANSMRVTPFPPSRNDRPVEVALVHSVNGYSLKVEGDGCSFPIAYELRDATGTTISTGVHRPPATDTLFTGSAGETRLLVKMADNAENNFGCNLVVSRL